MKKWQGRSTNKLMSSNTKGQGRSIAHKLAIDEIGLVYGDEV